MTSQPNPPDGNSVAGAGLSGAILTVALWMLDQIWGIKIPPEVASAMAVIVVTAGAWIGQRLRR
jgi:hypothetical protein